MTKYRPSLTNLTSNIYQHDSTSHFFNIQMSFLKNYHMARVLENTVLVYLIRDSNKKEVFSMKGLVDFKEIEK